MAFLLRFHGEIRWLVALVAAALVVRCVMAWARRADFGKVDRILVSAFVGLLDLNVLLGVVLLFGLPGGLIAPRLEHAVTMLLAALTAHLTGFARRSADPAAKFRNVVILVLAASTLVVIGVFRLRGGWVF